MVRVTVGNSDVTELDATRACYDALWSPIQRSQECLSVGERNPRVSAADPSSS
jgi:hypothetical protein